MSEKDKEYFLSQDNDAHWYVVPNSHVDEWFAWLDLDPDDPNAWEAPEFVERVNGSPSTVTFKSYEIE